MLITEAFFRSPRVGEHTDRDGLILVVRPSASGRVRKSWTLRVVVDGKRKKIGLGACGLAEARRRAQEARQLLHEGNDPSRRARARERASEAAAEARRSMTFGEAADLWLARAAPKFKNAKSDLIRAQALNRHLAPIRGKALTSISPADLVEILVALRPETALRVYTTAKGVFEFAAVLLEQEGVAPAPPTALLKLRALGWKPRSRRSHKPMPALPWKRGPELLAELENRPEPIARLMIFILATAARAGSARLAKRRDIDLSAKIWRIPISDLKDAAHRKTPLVLPLNDVALSAIPLSRGEFIFTDALGRPFTDRNVTHFVRKLRRLHPDWVDPLVSDRGFTIHGTARAGFRSWAAARREDRELVELCLGHAATVYGEVEAAYQRDPLLGPRAELMVRWARHLRGDGAAIIPMRRG
jgi:integrase